MRALYHTRPKGILQRITLNDYVFIEIDPLLKDQQSLSYFVENPHPRTILDCGVGASPNLDDPAAHTSKDPHWAMRWMEIMLRISPQVIVVPDLLGDAVGTRENFYRYEYVLDYLAKKPPELMYVIQGQSVADALGEIEFAFARKSIAWIGFPRVVHYYGECSTDELAESRINFVSEVLRDIRKAGKHVHLLGLNVISELQWASDHNVSMDTRLASLAAVHDFQIDQPRPKGVNIDLTETFAPEVHSRILENIENLNQLYSRRTPYVVEPTRTRY